MSMSMLHINVSMLHVHASLPMLHVHAPCPACPCYISMLHINLLIPFFLSMLHAHAACPGCIYLLFVLVACSCSIDFLGSIIFIWFAFLRFVPFRVTFFASLFLLCCALSRVRFASEICFAKKRNKQNNLSVSLLKVQ
jgi:F0F1-type ATP synthase assembly protein I